MKSIIKSEDSGCFFCGRRPTETHHCMHGTANRRLADMDGLTVQLCYEHHRGNYGVHGKYGHESDLKLKQAAEYAWLKYYRKTIADWIDRYGRNYL